MRLERGEAARCLGTNVSAAPQSQSLATGPSQVTTHFKAAVCLVFGRQDASPYSISASLGGLQHHLAAGSPVLPAQPRHVEEALERRR